MKKVTHELQQGARWRHVKRGSTYRIVALGLLESTRRYCVVYQEEDGGQIWIRPLAEFLDGRFEHLP